MASLLEHNRPPDRRSEKIAELRRQQSKRQVADVGRPIFPGHGSGYSFNSEKSKKEVGPSFAVHGESSVEPLRPSQNSRNSDVSRNSRNSSAEVAKDKNDPTPVYAVRKIPKKVNKEECGSVIRRASQRSSVTALLRKTSKASRGSSVGGADYIQRVNAAKMVLEEGYAGLPLKFSCFEMVILLGFWRMLGFWLARGLSACAHQFGT